ncbi:hypothetical protein [Aliiglaciecola sp. LCG003]|uniref:hypothetical protein n=1 Tax=Aliiglaciecola sp. LCG003 TaxID=3053655 RepID=UPI002573F2D0|nr:hypothetical protein [Aliiglaciecola sp. LCG003]WJG08315.1 hypothetical protein QR722_13315 [Aliiglaciecola sp. LCG003]
MDFDIYPVQVTHAGKVQVEGKMQNQQTNIRSYVHHQFTRSNAYTSPKPRFEDISVVGLGLIGTLLSVSFANNGHRVIAVDMDMRKVNGINQNHSPIQDQELEDAVIKARLQRKLVATADMHNAILQTQISLVCVGQISDIDNQGLSKTLQAIFQQLGASLATKPDYHLILLHCHLHSPESEQQVNSIIEQWSGKRCGKDFGLCFLPLQVTSKHQPSDVNLDDMISQRANDSKSAKLTSRLFTTLDLGLKSVSVAAYHDD